MDGTVYYNPDAEMSALGIAISYPEEALRKVTDLPSEIMYMPQNRELLECLKDMANSKSQVDLVTVNEWLIRHSKTDTVGSAHVMACISSAIGVAFLKGHLKILKECYERRRLRSSAKAYIDMLDSGENPEDSREWMVRNLAELKEARNNGLIPMKDALMTAYCQMDEDQEKEGQPVNRILSGISTLDNKLGGLKGSEYVAIGARPSVGKSVFALTYCVNTARQGKRVLLVSLEMNEVQIMKRILAAQTGVPLNEMESGHITETGWIDLAAGLGKLSNLPLWFNLEADTVEKVRRSAYELFETGGIDLIAVDYIQLMDAPDSRKQNREQQVSEISRGLRKLAAELKIPILVLTQLNRISAKGQMIKGKRVRTEPTMSEARESGAIEQDANIFMLLHDPDESEMRNEEEKETYRNLKDQGYQMMRIIIDKNRQGKRGRVTLAFDGDHMRFLPIVRNVETPY